MIRPGCRRGVRIFLFAAGMVPAWPAAAQGGRDTAGVADAPKRTFDRPKVTVPLFTHEKTALLEPECERIATFLAAYAAEQLSAKVLAGDASAHARGRLLLAVALQAAVQPIGKLPQLQSRLNLKSEVSNLKSRVATQRAPPRDRKTTTAAAA